MIKQAPKRLSIHNPTFQSILSFVNLALWIFVALCMLLR